MVQLFQVPRDSNLVSDESASDSEHSGAFSSSPATSLSDENENTAEENAFGYLSLPANHRELSPAIPSENITTAVVTSDLLESPDPRPRSSSLNSLVSDMSVAGSEQAVLESSSEGSNPAYVPNTTQSALPKPPTPTVAPKCASPPNMFLPIKDEEEVVDNNVPEDPTNEDLNAQEIFFGIAQLTKTLQAQDSLDFSGTFKSAVNKERFTNFGNTVVGMTSKATSKKMEFFTALTSYATINQPTQQQQQMQHPQQQPQQHPQPQQQQPQPQRVPQQNQFQPPPLPPRNQPVFNDQTQRPFPQQPIQRPQPHKAPPRTIIPKERIANEDFYNSNDSNQPPPPPPPYPHPSIIQPKKDSETEIIAKKSSNEKGSSSMKISFDHVQIGPKNGNVVQFKQEAATNIATSKPLSPKYDIPFPLDLPPKATSPRLSPSRKVESPRKVPPPPPPRPPPIAAPVNEESKNQQNLVHTIQSPRTKQDNRSPKPDFPTKPEPHTIRYYEQNDTNEEPTSEPFSPAPTSTVLKSTATVEDVVVPSPTAKRPSRSSSPATLPRAHAKAKESTTSRFLDEHYPQLTRSNSTLSNASTYSHTTQDLFSSISSVDLSGLASQTSNLLESMFGYPTSPTGKEPLNNVLLGNGGSSRYASIAADNHTVIKDAVDKVVLGEGIGWLKLNRLKRLMEDEMHRSFMLSYLQRRFGQHLTREGHIEDLCLGT